MFRFYDRVSAILPLTVALATVSFLGCGSGSGAPPLGYVSGVVTSGGKPMEGVYLEFHPTEGRMSNGTTDADGRFTLEYVAGKSGAVLGSHRVYFLVPPNLTTKQRAKANKDDAAHQQEHLQRLAEPKKINYEEDVTIVEGENELAFDLTGKTS